MPHHHTAHTTARTTGHSVTTPASILLLYTRRVSSAGALKTKPKPPAGDVIFNRHLYSQLSWELHRTTVDTVHTPVVLINNTPGLTRARPSKGWWPAKQEKPSWADPEVTSPKKSTPLHHSDSFQAPQ